MLLQNVDNHLPDTQCHIPKKPQYESSISMVTETAYLMRILCPSSGVLKTVVAVTGACHGSG